MGAYGRCHRQFRCFSCSRVDVETEARLIHATTHEVSRDEAQRIPDGTPRVGTGFPRSDHWVGCRAHSEIKVRALRSVCGVFTDISISKSANLPLPSNSETFSGDLTYYQTGLGACGVTSSSSDDIVSVSHIIFDAAGSSSSTGGNSNNNPLCGLKLRAKRYDDVRGEWRSVDLTVVDRCTGCEPNDLDVSYSAFDQIASRDKGRVDVTWAWL